MSGACFHCGSPVVATGIALPVEGVDRAFCSEDCRQVTAAILENGLAGFYRFREGPSAAPDAREASTSRWACYDRPTLQGEFTTTRPDGLRRSQLLLSGIRCAACVWLVERAMAGVPGVGSIAVDPLTGRADLAWDPRQTSLSILLARLASLGYTPSPYADDLTEAAAVRERRSALKRLIVAGLGMMQVGSYAIALYAGAFLSMDPEMEHFLRLISLVVATPVVFYAGAPFFQGAWRSLRQKSLGMDVPVALALVGAWAPSAWNTLFGGGDVYFDSATMFVFLLGSARYLEMAGRHRALSLTGALARHMPRVATRVRPDGSLEELGVMELVPGDTVLVAPGKAIPADGTLLGGEARIDESLLTGESDPVLRRAGEPVLAGSVNLLKAIHVQVRSVGAETTLAHISQLVTSAGHERPRLVRFADRVASGFVARILLIAALVGAYWWYADPGRAYQIVLAVLVVACPCAFAVATPAVYTVAMSALARRGFLVRRPAAIDALGQATDVIFDKTGTLTEGGATLDHVRAYGRHDPEAATVLAARLEALSEHPLARAFPVPPATPAEVSAVAVPGAGLEGTVDGESFRIGRLDFVADLAGVPAIDPAGEPGERRAVYLGDRHGLVARFELAERMRAGAGAAIGQLAASGLHPIIASGDHGAPVAAMGARLGVRECHADLRPEGKLGLLRGLQEQGRVVMMVGDGINDSPVLAGADVSVAMGSGTSLAQYAADCVLINPSLGTLDLAVQTSRRAVRIVRQNFGWALVYNLVGIPLAATGLIQPWTAALGMSLSSLLLTLNALRLARILNQRPAEQGGGLPSGSAAVVAS